MHAALIDVMATLADGVAPVAAAHAPTAAAAGGPGGLMSSFLFPMLMIFGVFYFMLIRPQQKKQKETTDWLKSLKVGDEVVTTGGVIGKITGFKGETRVVLEVQQGVRFQVLRSHITGKPPAPNAPASADPAPAPAATTK